MINPKTPVLVGSGQITQKIENFLDAKNPIELMHDASTLAIQDTGIEDLKNYIDNNFQNERVVVLGDFNDDISEEMTNNVFAEFLNNPESYFFTDTYIAEGSSLNWSFPSYPSHLDHILVTNELFIDTINTFTIQLDNYMIGGFQKYDNHISDHRPVGINL